ncbi:hypothetical protein GLOIN_2v1770997 [Rhizophagus irregularis DAOM 181602=DAOM 197198]|nr:hypothetical protein GLOIN_2v1770997 [Rhizophagus irregularis DAOM 181602=DAOM 197198]
MEKLIIEKNIYDSSKYEIDEENHLELSQGIELKYGNLLNHTLTNMQNIRNFAFRKKVILAENRRDRNSEMTGCPWYVNLAFFKSENIKKIGVTL